jgi:hypothetical protein
MLFTQILIFLDCIMMMMMHGLSDCLGWSLWSSCGSRSWFPKLSLFGLVEAGPGFLSFLYLVLYMQQVVVAESGFQSVFVSKSNGDSCTLNLQSWSFESFDLAVQDPSQVMDVLS